MKTFRLESDDGVIIDYELAPWPVGEAVENIRKLLPVVSPLMGKVDVNGGIDSIDLGIMIDSLAGLLAAEGDGTFIKRLMRGVKRFAPDRRCWDRVDEMMDVCYTGNLGELMAALTECLSINLSGPIKRLKKSMSNLDKKK